jgi:hypothetical protein
MCMQCVATASTSAAPIFAAMIAILGGMTWRHRRAERAVERSRLADHERPEDA